MNVVSNDQNIADLIAGSYNLVVTDANGCSIDTLITLTEPSGLSQTAEVSIYPSGDNISCFGANDGFIDITTTEGTAPYTFAWTGPNGFVANTESISDLEAGSYTLVITDDNGCQIDTTIVLAQPIPLVQDITSPTFPSGDNISCFEAEDGSIDYTVDGGSPGYVYEWSTGATSEDIADLGPGTYTVTVTDINGCAIDTTIVLTEPTPLVQDITSPTFPSGENISCFGAEDGSIDYTIDGGSPGYTYDWNTGATSEDLADLGPGTYTVTVTDINGCTIDTTIVLIEPTNLVQDITSPTFPSGDNISCFGAEDGSIDYTINGGSPGYTYDWSNGAATEDIADLGPGTYTVTVTDINGCTIDTTIVLTEPTPLVLDLTSPTFPSGDNISCFEAADGSIDLTIDGGSPGYTYDWSNGSTTADLSDLGPGTYTVTVTDANGCSIEETIELTEPDPLTITLDPSVYPGGFNTSGCFPDGSIDAIVNGGSAGYIYVWNNGENSASISNLDPGTYSVVVTDINGCQISDEITLVPTPVFTFELDAFLYPGDVNVSCHEAQDGSITLVTTNYNGSDISCFGANDGGIQVIGGGGTPPYTYSWTDQGGNIVGNGATVSNLGPGTYTVTVIDVNGCERQTSVVVNEPSPVQAGINILSDYFGFPISCENTNDGEIQGIGSGGVGGYSYSWNTVPAVNTANLNNIGVGSYTVTVTDANGCVADETVFLEGNELPVFATSDPQQLCAGELAVMNTITSADNSCSWTFSTGQVINSCDEFAINFAIIGCVDAYISVTSPLGCISTDTLIDFICYEPNPIAHFSPLEPNITTVPSNIQFWNLSEGGYFYEWDFGDGMISNETNPNHFFPDDKEGEYIVQLIVTTLFGCTDTAWTTVYVDEEPIIYVPNTFTPDGDAFNNTFFPVITSGYDPYDYELLIFNRWGEIVFESRDYTVGWDGTYRGEIVKEGTYVWKINVGSKKDAFRRVFTGHVNLLR